MTITSLLVTTKIMKVTYISVIVIADIIHNVTMIPLVNVVYIHTTYIIYELLVTTVAIIYC